MPPIEAPYDENGNYTSGEKLLGYPFSDSAGDNPLIIANEQLNQLTTSRFLGNMRTRYSLMDALSVEVMLGTDQTTSTQDRSEEHTSELQSLMRISYDVFCLKKKKKKHKNKQKTEQETAIT